MARLIIRPIDPTIDGPRVLKLRQLCGWGMDAVPLWLTQHPHDRITYLATLDTDPEPIGMCGLKLHDDEFGQLHLSCRAARIAESVSIFVRDEYQGQGYGKQLLLFTEQEARRLGMRVLAAHIWNENEKSPVFYQSAGFKIYMYGTKYYAHEHVPEGYTFVMKRLDD